LLQLISDNPNKRINEIILRLIHVIRIKDQVMHLPEKYFSLFRIKFNETAQKMSG